MEQIQLDIPVKKYIKKYFENKFGTPVSLTRRDKYGTLLYNLLEREDHKRDSEHCEYPEMLNVSLSSEFYHRRGSSLSITNVKYFNSFAEDEFKTFFRMYVFCRIDTINGTKKKSAIESFMQMMKLTENEFPYESAKKDIDRHLPQLKSSFSI